MRETRIGEDWNGQHGVFRAFRYASYRQRIAALKPVNLELQF